MFCIIISITYFYKKNIMNNEPLDPGIMLAIVLVIALIYLLSVAIDKKLKNK